MVLNSNVIIGQMEKIRVKLLGISCSYIEKSAVSWLVMYALKAGEKFGRRISKIADISTEFIDLAGKEIKPCEECQRFCMPNKGLPWRGTTQISEYDGECIIRDEVTAELLPKFGEADGFIFGSPVSTFSYNSLFRNFTERLTAALFKGYLTGKPFACVTSAPEARGGGQVSCLYDMITVLTTLEMISVAWGGPGATGISGDDGQRNDRPGNWTALIAGRRVTEFALMLKLSKLKMADIYTREFIQIFHPPHGDESWAWNALDEEDERFMMNLDKNMIGAKLRNKLRK